jgi:pyridoxamine 5'-phosphate oxidase family protein
VAFEFDGQHIYFSGWNLARTLKFQNLERNPSVAIVVDDVISVSPWRVRGVEIRGIAELLAQDGHPYVRIKPMMKVSWGL